MLKPFHLGNCEPPIKKGITTTPAVQTYAGAVGDLYRMQTMEESVANNTDPFSVICHQYDIEGETMLSCNVVTAIVNGVEMVIASPVDESRKGDVQTGG